MRSLLHVVAAAAFAAAAAAGPAAPSWREVAPGLEYAVVTKAGGAAHLFRADLRTWRASAVDARGMLRKVATVSTLARETKAPVVVNGTFFDEKKAPLGLLVERGRELHPLRQADWGVLAIAGTAGTLVHTRDWKPASAPDFAIQCGPRAVVAGSPMKLRDQGRHPRTALCLQAPDRLVLLVTEGAPTAPETAAWLAASEADGGVGCVEALLLDGGPSTQIRAEIGDVRLDVQGGWPVPNGVALVPR